MGAVDVTLSFNDDLRYESKLIDISTGGYSVRSPILSAGGMVYDQVILNISDDNQDLKLPSRLIRIERDPESEDNQSLLLAFQFINGFMNYMNVLASNGFSSAD